MAMVIKCIGCYDLLRVERLVEGQPLVGYSCRLLPPNAYALSGLLRPGLGVLRAVEACPKDPLSHCVVCRITKVVHYGQNIVSICEDHGDAWGKWLDEHPERRAHLAPQGRSVKANWVEVFREFVEDIRRQDE